MMHYGENHLQGNRLLHILYNIGLWEKTLGQSLSHHQKVVTLHAREIRQEQKDFTLPPKGICCQASSCRNIYRNEPKYYSAET